MLSFWENFFDNIQILNKITYLQLPNGITD